MANSDPHTLRISIDTKATVHVGEYSRGGQSRGTKPVAAWDHDMRPKKKLVPGGILETGNGNAFLFFSDSYKTSDFLVDGIWLWWEKRKHVFNSIKHLVINADNGPECSGHRSQFLKRIVEFVDKTNIAVRLIYYPPYHSKYNAVERYWAGLEKSWNGYLLDTIEAVLNRAANFSWKGVQPIVSVMNKVYEKGIKVVGKEKKGLEQRLNRSQALPWWDIKIYPKTVY